MANSYNTSQTTITSVNSPTTVFTASASTTLVKSIRVMHGSSTSSATLAFTKSGGSRTDMNTVTLSAGVTNDLITDVLPLAAGDLITVESTHQPTYVWVSYVENTTTVSGQTIGVLSDVPSTRGTAGQVLAVNSGATALEYVDQSGGGASVIGDLTDVSSATPTGGDVLEWNGTNRWTPTNKLTTLYTIFKAGTDTTVNNGAATDSSLELDTTTAKLKTGITEVKLTETSPGDIDLIVATDSTGSTAFTAVHVDGLTTANEARVIIKQGAMLAIEGSSSAQCTIRSTNSGNTLLNVPSTSGTIALDADIPTNVTDLSDVSSAGSGSIITSAERTKLSGIATGAEVNAVDSVNTQTGAVVLDADDISDASTTNKFTTASDITKLAGIETGADVTDTANVTAAGALMDSEVTNLAQVKAFDSSDYATAAQGTTADSALQNVVEDTTPQLGGDLDTNAKNILFAKTSPTNHSSNGDIIKLGSGSTTQGQLHYFNSSGGWTLADADASGTAGGVLLAIALGNDPDVDGMLLRGFYTLSIDPGTAGDELYVDTTAGRITNDVSGFTAGDIVRVVGYCIDSTDGIIWFNPSNDFIELG